MAKEETLISHENGKSNSSSSSKVRINKWILIACVIFFILAAVAVGLGVYYGTRCQNTTITTTATTTTGGSTTPTPPDIRLPTSLLPLEYVLTVKTYIPSPTNVVTFNASQMFTFDGDVIISINATIDTATIVMQMSQINISTVDLKVLNPDGTEIDFPLKSNSYTYDDVTEEVTFYPESSLKGGSVYLLHIVYIGQLSDDLRGFYRSSYEEDGQLKWLAVTQFEPTDARRALPCFDEPSFKANFTVTIIHPSDMAAISNGMEIVSIPLQDNWMITNFTTTPKQSTYLLAMCVARFENRNKTSEKGVLFRVWARPSFIDDSWYAVQKGPEVLDYYADYFEIPFPLVKQDMIALPDFQAGAMENWGMVTYREIDLLFHNGTCDPAQMQNTATVIAHELAHQWFGDLVTLDWWDDIWLNEGFAAYMQYKGVNHITKFATHQQLQFVPLEEDVALLLDELSSSHPLYDPSLKTPDQIFGAFDDIAYDKGSSVIHMLEQTVGEHVMRQGLIHYLTTHEYGNAAHQDLWDAIQWSVNTHNTPNGWDVGKLLDVTAFMNPFVVQMGYPVVEATRDYTQQTVELKQKYFVLPGNFSGNTKYQNASFTWYVPIWITSQTNHELNDFINCWITPTSNSVQSPLKYSNDEYIILNNGVKGYYRVNYDNENWEKLHSQLRTDHNNIDPRNRAQLLDDSLNLARAGMLDYSMALNTTLYLNKEFSFIPWNSVSSSFSYFNDMFALNADYQSFGRYLESKISPIYEKMTWDDSQEPFQDVLPHNLRQYAIGTMCQLENTNCLEAAYQNFTSFKDKCKNANGTSDCSNVNANVRKTVYCAGVSQGSADDFNYLYTKYPQEQIAIERDNLLYGLCCSKDPWALTKLLNQAINPNSSFIRQQDSEYVFQYVSGNNVGREILWDYFTTNWVQISNLFSSGFFSLGTIIQSATRSFNTQAQIQQMKDFLQENGSQLGSGTATYIQQLEVAQANANWMQQYSPQVVQWFNDNV